jgi:hypothetical protein
MNESLELGVGLTMVAGILSGNSMLPMKFVRSWKWENIWLIFSVVSLRDSLGPRIWLGQ